LKVVQIVGAVGAVGMGVGGEVGYLRRHGGSGGYVRYLDGGGGGGGGSVVVLDAGQQVVLPLRHAGAPPVSRIWEYAYMCICVYMHDACEEWGWGVGFIMRQWV
jgi:hypothetical protein